MRRKEAMAGAAGAGEAALVQSVARGDAAAFRLLVDRYLADVHRLAARTLGDASEAEEVAQETFLKLWTHAARWRPGEAGTVLPWLRRIAVNAALDRIRRRRPQTSADLDSVPDERGDTAGALDRERIGAVTAAALDALGERQRAAIVLTYYEELSNGEAAAALDLQLKAFESLLHRARAALREELGRRGISAELLGEAA